MFDTAVITYVIPGPDAVCGATDEGASAVGVGVTVAIALGDICAPIIDPVAEGRVPAAVIGCVKLGADAVCGAADKRASAVGVGVAVAITVHDMCAPTIRPVAEGREGRR